MNMKVHIIEILRTCFVVGCNAGIMDIDAMGKFHVIIFGVMFCSENCSIFNRCFDANVYSNGGAII